MGLFALRSLLARRRRAGLSTLAVMVGVAIVAGTFVFTDTIHAALRHLLRDTTSGAKVVVSSPQGPYAPANPPADIPARLVSRIRSLPGVAAVEGQISDTATIVARDGHPLKPGPVPTLAVSYLSKPFTGTRIVAGSPPRSADEVALDRATAARAGYKLGDSIPIVTGQPARRFKLSGIVSFQGASTGGVSVAVFDPAAAAALFSKQNQVNVIYVAGASSTPATTLEREIRPLLGSQLTVRTAAAEVSTDLHQLASQLQVLTGGLRAFGFISLFVAAFLIFNALSITVAQRARELALLRALGALRRQVLVAVLVEALVVGACASAAGLTLGLLAALAIRAVFSALGVELPSAGLVLLPRTIFLSLGLGLAVTGAAGLVPAVRATRLSPLQALRDIEAPPARWGRSFALLAVAGGLAAAGVALAFAASGSFTARVGAAALGAGLVVLAGVVASPLAVPYLARVLAWPLERRSPVVARLARENVTRTPARTALTCSSLMIGLALVLFVLVYVGGVRSAAGAAVQRTFAADFAIGPENGSSSIPASSVRAAALSPGVLVASAIKSSTAQLGGDHGVTASGVDPVSFGTVYRFQWQGAHTPLADLGPGEILVERDLARAQNLHVGERVRLRTGSGTGELASVSGIYADSGLLRGLVMPLSDFDRLFTQQRLAEVLVKAAPFVAKSATEAQLKQSLSAFPGVVVRSERQVRAVAAARTNAILVLFYALLAVSVVMALLGTANALTLSIHERTRELGMLRALGMARAQARGMIRQESIITGALGTLVGVGLGVLLAFIMTRPLASEGVDFALPWPPLLIVVGAGLASGLLAALAPAARVARLDVLQAIATE